MLGYLLQKTTGRDFSHIYLQIYTVEDNRYYTRIMTIGWQTDPVYDNGWYGYDLKLETGLYRSGFNEAVKLINSIERADLYTSHPEDMLKWLLKKKAVQILYDERLQRYNTVENYLETKNLTSYRFYCGSDYIDLFLAKNLADAKKIVYSNCVDGEYSGSQDKLDRIASWDIRENAFNNNSNLLFVDQWLASPY